VEFIPIFTTVLVLGAVAILGLALLSQTIHRLKNRASSRQQFGLEAPQYFRRYRAAP